MKSQDFLTVLLLIIIFVGLFCLLVYYIRSKHQQKMEIIKKGDYLFENNSQLENMKYSSINSALLLFSLGLGILSSYLITESFKFEHPIVLYFATTSLFLGGGFFVFYLFIRHKE